MSKCNQPPVEAEAPEPEDFLVALVGRMIERSAPPCAQALDYARLLDSTARSLKHVPAIPPGVIAREEFRQFVECVLNVRDELGIEAEQAWVARRFEGRPTPEVARAMGRPADEVGELVLNWEYNILRELRRRAEQ
jgi:DNA-directed RNA polymerase specialized sigma24 family protein